MGGCASKPKDMDTTIEPAPVAAPAPAENPEAETVAQDNNGGEIKKEEPLVDVSSEPAEEAPKKEETKDESALPAEQPVETKVEEAKPEEVAAAPTAAEAELEKKAEEVAMVAATAAPKTTTTSVEAKKSDDKSDAPLVSF